MPSRLTFRLLGPVCLAAACTPAPRQMTPIGATPSPVPERVRAPQVPALEGVPQAVKVGLTVYLSGMVPVDSVGRVVGTSVAAQATRAAENLAAVVAAARGVPGDVVHVTIYLRDLTPADVSAARRAVLAALDPDTPPAITVVGVSQLPEPSMQVMLDGVAQLRSEFPDRDRMRRRNGP